MTNLGAIFFDQYSRYFAAAAQTSALVRPDSTVLDVGSGVLQLLGHFLPEHRITYIDPLFAQLKEHSDNFIPHSLNEYSPDHKFDVVVAVDTLEHVPPEQRKEFVERLMQLAQEGVVLMGPLTGDVDGVATHVDAIVNASYRLKTGSDFSWLAEHFKYGLPNVNDVREQFCENGWQLGEVGHGHAPWLETLLPITLGLLDSAGHHQALHRISDAFNRSLIRFDHLSPCYRRVLVATPPGRRAPCPTTAGALLRDTSKNRAAMRQAWDELWSVAVAHLCQHVDDLLTASENLVVQIHDEENQTRTLKRTLSDALTQTAKYRESARDSAVRLAKWRDQGEYYHAETLRLRSQVKQLESGQWARSFLRRIRQRGRRFLGTIVFGTYRRLPERAKYPAARLFFVVFGRVMQGTHATHCFEQMCQRRLGEKNAKQTMILNGKGEVQFSERKGDLPDVLMWGVIDWHFRTQRPQHLAQELARRGHRVFYFTPQFILNSRPGFKSQSVFDFSAHEGACDSGSVYQIALHVPSRYRIYDGPPPDAVCESLRGSVRQFLKQIGIQPMTSIFQHPSWYSLAEIVPAVAILYDCMDHHDGFSNMGSMVADLERRLFQTADTVIVSAKRLYEMAAEAGSRSIVMVPNAAAYAHFASPPANSFKDDQGRSVIGYFGAIADWFDVDLVRKVAMALPDCLILLVGADSADVKGRLADLSNVVLVGEVPFEKVPFYLYGFDVCTIPFILNDLTRATNPVKVYEYLAAGRPVVATALPELQQSEFEGLVQVALDHEEFIRAVRRALEEPGSRSIIERRRGFASRNTWPERVDRLETQLGTVSRGRVTIIIVTWNNRELSRSCLESVLADGSYSDIEVIIIDNASEDGTPDLIEEVALVDPRVRLIRNDENHGFPAANNQGLREATGRFIVFLNNDTVVTQGWLRTLTGHLERDPSIGIIGPVTNNIGNEARVPTCYSTIEEMHVEASRIMSQNVGKVIDMNSTAFFCVMLRREIVDRIGELDENFGIGYFEDDDYCQRILAENLRVVCAEDVFIHHELAASFNKVMDADRQLLFDRNRMYYESKWGHWQPHEYRNYATTTA